MGNFNGGIIGVFNSTYKGNLITTFTASNPIFAVQTGTTTVSLLVVAGGGNANAGGQAGAGGAGGYRSFPAVPVTPAGPYPITVGGAQSPSSAMGYSATAGAAGNAPRNANGLPGGSGGGAADHFPGGGGSGGSGNAGGYTPPEGNPGSAASPSGNNGETPGAGGGSAGAGTITPVGGFAYNALGGPGTANSITGIPLWYATGGSYPGDYPGPVQSLVTAAGYPSRAYPGDQPGMANTGNGAQGEGPVSGASGVVVVNEPGVGPVVANGVWNLKAAFEARKAGTW